MIVDAPKIQSGKKICANGLTGRLSEAALGYQRMLEQNPCHPDALVGISLVALASRQHEAAVKMAEAAVAAAPEMVVAWVALGQRIESRRPRRGSRAGLRRSHFERQRERHGADGAG